MRVGEAPRENSPFRAHPPVRPKPSCVCHVQPPGVCACDAAGGANSCSPAARGGSQQPMRAEELSPTARLLKIKQEERERSAAAQVSELPRAAPPVAERPSPPVETPVRTEELSLSARLQKIKDEEARRQASKPRSGTAARDVNDGAAHAGERDSGGAGDAQAAAEPGARAVKGLCSTGKDVLESWRMKVFWSWQSDTPGKTGRFLVRDAIAAAIQKLKQAEDITEPTEQQRAHSLHLDQDRQGLPGSPDLADAIFKKIEEAAVVIADVTIVARGKGSRGVKGRAFINPNVGIEVGYALKAVGSSNLLLAVNTHHGPTEELPFDLRHKGISLVYSLAEDAAKPEIDAARDKLVSTLVPALRHYIKAPSTTVAQQEIVKQPAQNPPAFFFGKGETLARIGVPGEDEIQFSMQMGRSLYLRLIPTRRRAAPLTPRELLEKAGTLGTLWTPGGNELSRSNEWGYIVFHPQELAWPEHTCPHSSLPYGRGLGHQWISDA